MSSTLLVLNAGSSSVKFRLFNRTGPDLLLNGQVSGIGGDARVEIHGDEAHIPLDPGTDSEGALTAIIDYVHSHASDWQVSAVAHRIVHGGTRFTAAVRLDDAIMAELADLIPLAPLHQPHNLAAVTIAQKLLGDCPQIGCFDTAFHAGHDPLFTHFALDDDLFAKGVRRYGFHGLSYAWIAEILRREHPDLYAGRVIAAHLGNGASLCALHGGRSIDTTMGMTALDGLPMGTRCGALDAGAAIYMQRALGFDVDTLEHRLYEHSGLKGMSGLSNDVARLLSSPDPKARFALDYFALKVAQYIAMMAVSLGGVDAIVFTGGIGEHAAPIRDAIRQRLAFLADKPVLIIPANEEAQMASEALKVLSA